MMSPQPSAGRFLLAALVLVGEGCLGGCLVYAAGIPGRMSKPAEFAATDLAISAAPIADTGYLMKAADDADKNGAGQPTGEAVPASSPSSGPIKSATTGSRTVSGGRFPSQPLNFPPEINQGPGWTVPQGPYRPLPARPPVSTTKSAPE
jgi:hypothetical protein